MSGRQVFLDSPKPDSLDVYDMGHHMSMQCRFNGACINYYSVAQHSVLVSYLVEKAMSWPDRFAPVTVADYDQDIQHLKRILTGLFHDSPETYTGDLAKPVKKYIEGRFVELENNLLRIILQKYGGEVWCSDSLLHPCIKEADRLALAIEKKYLMIPIAQSWGNLPNAGDYPPIVCLQPEAAKFAFLERFHDLTDRINSLTHTRNNL
jgi:hypothetical protein